MMKILFLIFISIIPFSLYSSLSILAITLAFLSFFVFHYSEFFKLYQMMTWDSLSHSLISLTLLITILMFLSSMTNKNIMNFKYSFISISTMLLILLTMTFSVSNVIMFYVLFEASLIPIFMIILGWGNQPERLQAGMYMLIYTVLSSLPLLVSLILWTNFNHSTSMFLLYFFMNKNMISNILAFTLILAFSVKLPLYLLHLWLPKAHVEAPVAGSMILAAILLKLGGYGIMRIASKSHFIYYYISPVMLSWSLTGGVMIALVCLFQTDIKFLIALSSVAHMSLVIASILTFSSWGINSAQFIMIGHGFCSSGLFCIANMVYERINSRSLFLLKGLQVSMASFSMMWFLLCTSNMAAPPSLNLLGEMSSISSIFPWSSTLIILLMLLVFLAAAYSLFLFSQTQHGKTSSSLKPVSTPSVREWLTLLTHWIPLNIIILAPWTLQIFF